MKALFVCVSLLLCCSICYGDGVVGEVNIAGEVPLTGLVGGTPRIGLLVWAGVPSGSSSIGVVAGRLGDSDYDYFPIGVFANVPIWDFNIAAVDLFLVVTTGPILSDLQKPSHSIGVASWGSLGTKFFLRFSPVARLVLSAGADLLGRSSDSALEAGLLMGIGFDYSIEGS